jgi:hypothetical protein
MSFTQTYLDIIEAKNEIIKELLETIAIISDENGCFGNSADILTKYKHFLTRNMIDKYDLSEIIKG